MTDWPFLYGYKKTLVWPTNKTDLGVGYQRLCTNLGDGIVYFITKQ